MAESTTASLTELPYDIFVLILPYLDARSFLNLCGTCKAFQQPPIRSDAAYWNHVTRTTFRVPNQPVIQADAQRWEHLYKRLLAQSRVFTWGSNGYNCLGQTPPTRRILRRGRRVPGRVLQSGHIVSTPGEMKGTRELGIIADIQCGGWSTTLLTSSGKLYTTGIQNGLSFRAKAPTHTEPSELEFPLGYPHNDSCVSIKQFSSGRSHVLGLSDSGMIWSWFDERQPAWHIKFLHVDTLESDTLADGASKRGRVRQVVAGWSLSSAYVSGTGILLWKPPGRSDVEGNQSNLEQDTILVHESIPVPFTGYQRPGGSAREPDQATRQLGEDVGTILNYIVLEGFIVFVSDLGRFFASKIDWEDNIDTPPDVIELASLRAKGTRGKDSKTDVQGSFRSFAVFKDGEVITLNQDYLDACWNFRRADGGLSLGIKLEQGLKRIPALQHSGVISVAFGDYHFHALHRSGHITSYGREPKASGCLGLGGPPVPDPNSSCEGRLRGIRYGGRGGDGDLVKHAYTYGRRVWFEPEKKEWLRFMAAGGRDTAEAGPRTRLVVSDSNVQGEVSEWFEQEGKDWDKRPEVGDLDEDGLGAYFVLSITAAGWHSGALVLVNDALAQKVRQQYVTEDESSQAAGNGSGSGPDEASDAEDDNDDGEQSTIQNTLASRFFTWASGWVVWYLGLPHRADTSSAEATPDNHASSSAPEPRYAWADDSFPRLRLSNGNEMPGEVEFAEWREGVPVWDLEFDA